MDRKLEIIQCARELIEERGLAKTSVAAWPSCSLKRAKARS